MAEIINDWVVRVGFDDTEVLKGTKRIEKAFQKLEKMQSKLNRGFKQPGGTTTTRTGGSGGTSASGLNQTNKQIKILNTETAKATKATRKQSNAMQEQGFAAAGLRDSMKNLARSYISIFAVIQGGRAFFKAGTEMESLRATFLAASGSVTEAGENFEFVKEAANRIGISVTAAGKGFAKIAASAKGAGLDIKETKNIFLAASEASRTFGLNAERTNLVMLAFSQILSKGKVSQEELRRQLGEQLPGVMTTAAKAMGVTTGRLEEMIKAGLPATEFIGKFSDQLRKQVRENGALEKAQTKVLANVDRFGNAFVDMADQLFNAGGAGAGLNTVFTSMTSLVNGLTPVVVSLSNGIGAILNAVSFVLTPLTSLLNLIGGSGTGLTIAMSLVTAGTLNWAASMIFGKAAMDKLTFSGILNFLKGLTLASIGTSIATKGFLGWAASIFTTVGALRALKLALGPVGLAFLALEGVGALVGPSTPTTPTTGGGNTVNNNNVTANITNNVTASTDLDFQDQQRQSVIDALSSNQAMVNR